MTKKTETLEQAYVNDRPSLPVSFQPRDIREAAELAERLSKSTLIPAPLRGKPGDVLAVLLTGIELGLMPMASLRGIYVVGGKAIMSADTLVALVVRNRSVCSYFRLVKSTDSEACYETMRLGNPAPVAMSFTIEQAKQAELLGKDNWKSYPSAMLRARCAAALVRAVYPDLALGCYDSDELEAGPHVSASPVVETSVVSTPAPVVDSPPEVELVESAILAAASNEELDELVPRLQRLSEQERYWLRPVFKERKQVLSERNQEDDGLLT